MARRREAGRYAELVADFSEKLAEFAELEMRSEAFSVIALFLEYFDVPEEVPNCLLQAQYGLLGDQLRGPDLSCS